MQGELCMSNSVVLAEQSRLGGGFLVMLETLKHDESCDRPVGVVLWSKEGIELGLQNLQTQLAVMACETVNEE